eukprot:TRINITY_DN15830_c0_g2_i1.p1 TRINITY_DN15830_c0_g2~~TRINITY_DN15830_c0_g2_i1.p1  ORF type:complete len:680 (-),score=64.53 TRINITY_DN15830_c0_g2_i1:43-2028(-)
MGDDPQNEPVGDADWGTWITLCLYAVSLFVIAFFANRRKRAARLVSESVENQFGGQYSALVLGMSFCATNFSAYAVDGVPADAYDNGFGSLRWFGICTSSVAGMLLMFPRLRRLAMTRGYASPSDFIVDRFRSRSLRYASWIACIGSSMIYLCVQVDAFGTVVRDITFGRIPVIASYMIFVLMLFSMEKVGGMAGVMYSDVVQYIMMICALVMMMFFLVGTYGLPESYVPLDCPNLKYVSNVSGDRDICVGNEASTACIPSGCIANVKPEILQPPSATKILDEITWVVLLTMSMPINYHMIQKCYIAKSDWDLKAAAVFTMIMTFVCLPPCIIMGLTKAANDPSWPLTSRAMLAFGGSVKELGKAGIVEHLVSTLANCAFLAAIMSTADSLVIGVSATVSLDVYKGVLNPFASKDDVVFVGECASLLQLVVAVPMALNSPPNVMLLEWQNGVLAQILPAVVLGLYTQIGSRAVSGGACCGLLAYVHFVFVDRMPGFPPVVLGLVVNLVIVFVVQFTAPGDDDMIRTDTQAMNARFGQRLTLQGIEACMSGTKTPSVLGPIVMVLLGMFQAPFFDEGYDRSELFMGVPLFAIRMVVFNVAAILVGVVWIVKWKPAGETEFFSNERRPTLEEQLTADRAVVGSRFSLSRRGSEERPGMEMIRR